MDKLTDRVFKTKIMKTFKSKKFDRKLVSELDMEFENRTDGLDENEMKLWKKYDDALKAMINDINVNELFDDNNGDDDMDRNESDADDDDDSVHSSQLDDDDDDSHDSSSESDAEIENEMEKLRRKLKDLSLKKKNKRKSRSKSDVNNGTPIYRIINSIKPFKDNVAEWPAFKRRVESLIIDRKNESECSKRAFISGIVKGKASSIWDHCETKRMNLKKSWKALSNEFENPDHINLHIQSMILKMSNVKDKYDVDGLERIKSQIEEFRNAVSNLGPRYIDNTSQMVWKIADKFWKKESEIISAECRSLDDLVERVKKAHRHAITWAQRSAEHKLSVKSVKNVDPRSKTSSIRTVVTKPMKKCFLCDKPGHMATACKSELSSLDKKKIVFDKGLCRICLWPGHKSSDCRRKDVIKCTSCNDNHPSSLHGINFDETEVKTVATADMKVVREATGTNIGKFRGRIGRMECDVLIDSGADVSVVSSDLAPLKCRRKVTPIMLCGFEKSMSRIVDQIADIVLSHPNGESNLEAYVSDRVPSNNIIVGRDHMVKLFREGHRVWHTVFGDIDLASMKVINVIEQRSEKRIVHWNENDCPEEVDDGKMNLRMEKLDNGRFKVSLPFFSSKRPPNNFNKAVEHLDRLQSRLNKKGLLEQYESELMKYVENNHAEIINETDGYFIPHHEVERPDAATTKFRIVLNASFGWNSLNDLLWKGESLNLNTLPHLVRIRMAPFLCIGDLQKAFLQIVIDESDRQYLRFLWKDRNDQLMIMQMIVLPFGVISAPAILTQVVSIIINNMSSNSRNVLENSMYMDDLLAVSHSESLLMNVMNEAKSSFESSGFVLHKMVSNSTFIRDCFGIESSSCKLLGLVWNCINDYLNINWKIPDKIDTKRKLLRFIGQLFDPLGFCEPVKLLFRKEFAMIQDKDWDDDLNEDIVSKINDLTIGLNELNKIKFVRYVEDQNQLSCFVDASIGGYGYAIYLEKDLIFGKSKISPRGRTIVDLELLALYEGVKATSRIVNYLKYNGKIEIFTDSQINIDRLKSSPNEYPIAIARRLLSILMIGFEIRASFRHISGKHNPADLFSRGCNAERYIAAKPYEIDIDKLISDSSEPIVTKLICAIRETLIPDQTLRNWMDKCGVILKMTKWIQRCMNWMEIATNRKPHFSAIHTLYMIYQRSELKRSDNLIDKNGLLHFWSRDLENQPIWIPKNSVLANEMLKIAHRKSLHRGCGMSLAMVMDEVRVANANRHMKKIINECTLCRMIRGKAIKQPLGPLHEVQKRFMKPFECIMMDAFGPLTIANGKKCYGIVIMCRTTKAVKVSVLENLSENSLYDTLRTVWNQIGYPTEVWSDNGTNFMAVREKLNKLARSGQTNAINWKTSTPLAPWMNGAAERMIRLVKECLKMLPKRARSLFSLQRNFNYVEYVINQRPIIQNDGRFFSAFELWMGRTMNLKQENNIDDVWEMKIERSKFVKEVAKLWMSQYLKKLARMSTNKSTDVQIGDWLMLPEFLTKRSNWPIGQVMEVKSGSDGICRTVKIRINGTELWRPTNRLIWITHSRRENCSGTSYMNEDKI